jgi:hypothetical protein
MILMKVFLIGALLIISNGELALVDGTNREIFVERYYSWVSELFDKGSTLAGYVIGVEWLPDKEFNESLTVRRQ